MSEEAPKATPSSSDADHTVGRIGAGFLLIVYALLAWDSHGTDSGTPLIEPDFGARPRTFSFATLLDKFGDAVGRAYCWIEAKFGLTPKE